MRYNHYNLYKATEAVLQTIRDRLSFEQMVHFSANLPLIMKGMMIDGYDTRDKPLKIRSRGEFFEMIQRNYDAQRRDTVNTREATRGVIKVLKNKIGDGEMSKVEANMPEKNKAPIQEPR